jgi:peptidoglycan DL-endopeptidase RipA
VGSARPRGQPMVDVVGRGRRALQWATRSALAVVLACGAVLLPVVPASAVPAADPADVLAARVAQLSAQLSAPQQALASAQALAAIALDDYQAKQSALQAAQDSARAATEASARSADDLAAARAALVAFVRRSYMSGSTSPGAEALVTADPAQYVERTVLLHSAGAYRADELGRFADALQAADRARTAAAAAADRAAALGRDAATSLATAQSAERDARAQAAAAGQQTELRAQLAAVQQQLVALVGPQDAAARIARAEAALAATAGSLAPAGPVANGATAGPPDPAAVATAIAAARRQLGVTYSWGGGGSTGPGYGVEPDAGVIGFDCSGLTQYAYAQAGIALPRNAQSQFSVLPKVARDQLQAGDLVFWATDPANWQTIHHVAVYLGDGTVLQAPETGDVVKVSPMWWDGYAGAVRPTG